MGCFRPALGQRSGFHEGIFGTALHGADLDDLEGTLGQGAGLIEDDDAGIGQLFQIGRALTRMPQAEAPPMPPKKLSGIEMTSAQGQLMTRKVRAR